MNADPKNNSPIAIAVDIFIKLGFLVLLIIWCFQIILPFSSVILWGIILALALNPVYNFLNKKLGNRPKAASLVIILIGLLIILIPSWLFLESIIEGVKVFKTKLESGTLTIPPPSDEVADWPFIGQKVYDLWQQASDNLASVATKFKDQISTLAKSLISGFLGIGADIVKFMLAVIIAAILLVTKGTDTYASKFFKQVAGRRGEEFKEIVSKTVGNVTKGILGVAFIQALLVGIGFLLAGVPYAGIWALLVMVLTILQLPATIVVIPIVVYLFSSIDTVPALLWSIYLIAAGISDNVIKPILLGRGAAVPMLVIFLGVIGGFMLSGFIGLFTGAIVLSIGYKLLIAWIDGETNESESMTEG
mgnify:CR=1 FL=1